MRSHLLFSSFCCILVFLLQICSARSDELVFELGIPISKGNGCPDGTVSVTLSPDHQALSLIFDQYSAQAGQLVESKRVTTSCLVKIPIQLPRGYFLVVSRVDYRGFHSLPSGAKSLFASHESYWVDHRFISDSGLRIRTFYGPLDQDFLVSTQLKKPIRSRCGGKIEIHLQSWLTVKTNSSFDQTLSSMDSIDVLLQRVPGPNAEVKFLLKPCKSVF